MLWLCEPVPAQQALEWGLVNRVVKKEELDVAVAEMADKLIHKMPEIIRYAKQQVNFWRDLSWSMTVGHARDWLAVHADADETAEGLAAFYEKREVDYEGLRRDMGAGQQHCGNCGELSPARFKYCGNCGSPLGGASMQGNTLE